MKLSISLSAILVLLPSLVAASSPLEARDLSGNSYFPRHRARNFGRQRQGAFGGSGFHHTQSQGGIQQSQVQAQGGFHHGQGASSTVATSSTARSGNQSQSSTSVVAAVATTTSAANGGNQSKSTTTTAAAAATTSSATGRGRNRNKSTTAASAASTDTTSSTAAASTDTAAASNTASSTTSAADVGASVADNNPNDPNKSLTLLSDLVATGLEQDGQATPVAGQVPSLTSKNNFINFCVGKTITNGQQITTGSCDPIPMGDIIPKANMPKCKFKNPKNFSTIPANQAFTVEMFLDNMQAGVFTNAQKTYYMAPQQLNGQGILIGHTHFVIQKMGDFADPTILDPATFTFFKGVNTGQVNGVVSADVTAGVPPGNYRLASINTSSNHAPAVAAVAQHGFLDDMIYFTAQ